MAQSQAPSTFIKRVLKFDDAGYKIKMIKDPSMKKSMMQKFISKITPSTDANKKLPK